jgi:hypothetical protein
MPGLVASESPEASSTRCSAVPSVDRGRCLLYLKARVRTQHFASEYICVLCALMELESKTARELTLAIDCACELLDRLERLPSMECVYENTDSKVYIHQGYD